MSDRRHIIVTGASSGIGRAAAEALAREGHHLYVCARRKERLLPPLAAATYALAKTCDVSEEKDVLSFFDAVAEVTEVIDAVVHCAGGFGEIGPIAEADSRSWWKTLQTNLYGTFLVVKHALPLLRKAASPSIVTFSGGGAFNPVPNYSAYAVSKAGVVRLTETLAAELALQGIRVNAVAPGFVATEIHQDTLAAGISKAGEVLYREALEKPRKGAVPVEVPVELIKFLVSDASRELTGKTISARFDPWKDPAFREGLEKISKSSLYTMQRINAGNLPKDDMDDLANIFDNQSGRP